MKLPTFKYHPDPLATGSIVPSDETCNCCVEARGYVYDGPTYGEDEFDGFLCPWCIADGSAHEEYEISFTDEEGIGGYGEWDEVSEKVIETIAYRTPGFTGWQQEQWWTHCGDGAAFLGRMGRAELEALGADAVAAIREASGMAPGIEWEAFLSTLSKEGSATASLFRCTKCKALGGYTDSD